MTGNANRRTRRALLRGASVMTAAGLSAAFVAACGGGGGRDGSPSGAGGPSAGARTEGGTPQRGGEVVLRRDTNIAFWDPQRSSGGNDPPFIHLFAERLLTRAGEGKLAPNLAEAWEQTNETTITVKLRKDVQFGDGTPLNSEAVKYTIERGKSRELGAPVRPTHSLVARVLTPDPQTAVLELESPNAIFIDSLAGNPGRIISPAAHQKLGDAGFNRTPVGAGPYVVKEIVPDGESVFIRNESWPMTDAGGGRLPYPDRVKLKIISESPVAVAALRSGEIDIDTSLTLPNVPQIKGQREIDVVTRDGVVWAAAEFVTNAPPTDKVALRRAINYAIDRNESNQTLAAGLGKPSTGPLTALNWAFDPSTPSWPYDPAKAKENLAAAGFPNGLELKCATYNQEQAELLQAQLARHQIRLVVDRLELAVYQDRFRAKGQYPIGTAGGPVPEDDPYEMLLTRYGSKGKYNPGEPTYPEWDALLTQAARTFDREERKKLYMRMQQMDYEQAYRAWIISMPRALGVRSAVQGLGWAGSNPDLRLVWKREK